MRTETIETTSYNTAKRRCPWAAIIMRVSNGFIAFESLTDYYITRNQK